MGVMATVMSSRFDEPPTRGCYAGCFYLHLSFSISLTPNKKVSRRTDEPFGSFI